jgi:hypothetical protein
MSDFVQAISALITNIDDLRTLNDMIAQDSTLIDRYFAEPGARTDIVAADVTAASNSITQVIFAYDSGSPPQKAALYKMLP